MSAAVLLFARTPRPGAVNTRLIPVLGEEGAARLHTEMLRWKAAELGRVDHDVQLWVTSPANHPVIDELVQMYGFGLFMQSGGDLGERMGRALTRALRSTSAAVLLGTDCPALPGSAVEDALAALSTCDAVLSPAEDGGFGLIGLKRFEPHLFEAIPWGSGQVLESVRRRMRELGWRWHELDACWDVDRPSDLHRLLRYPDTPDSIRALLGPHA
jgi:rSAM/selenodomain-associated transferase 1